MWSSQSTSFALAQRCRRDLEDADATLIFTYFPPNTFQGGAGRFQGAVVLERPLWTGRKATMAAKPKAGDLPLRLDEVISPIKL